MPRTNIWNRFGQSITDHPQLTLAAFLGDADSKVACKDRSIICPTLSDFQTDTAYDPNPHELSLDAGYLRNDQLVLCLMTWGKVPVLQIANACSHMQLTQDLEADAAIITLRNETALAVQAYIDDPSADTHRNVSELAHACGALYEPFEDDPDIEEAAVMWHQLGAPWFAAEAVAGDWDIQPYDGEPPAEGQSTWMIRNAVWPSRAADSASQTSSYQQVHDQMKSTAIAWALSG